jgi:hypothetical protein
LQALPNPTAEKLENVTSRGKRVCPDEGEQLGYLAKVRATIPFREKKSKGTKGDAALF